MTGPYLVEFNGDCLGRLIEPGAMLTAVPGAEIRPFDLVAALVDSLGGPWAPFLNSISGEGYAGLVKVFLGVYEVDDESVYVLGQLNPPTIALIPESAIMALHRIDFQGQALEADREALDLLAPFAGLGMRKVS